MPPELKSIEVILVSRAEMARIHGAFLGDATETDVVTFPYGEIVVCPAVARDVSAQHGQTVEEEVLLYALHGLLHLAGFDDTTPALARKMEKAQTAFFRRVWKSAPE